MDKIRHTLLPILAAFIWGTAFVAQSKGADLMPPFAFNAIRSFIAVIVLLLVRGLFSGVRKEPFFPPRKNIKPLLISGVICGLFLTAAQSFQQMGLGTTDPGKSGFITALYMVLVPIAGLFFKKKAPFTVWIAVAVAAVGLYFLCITETFTIEPGDLLTFFCAISYTAQIMAVDYYSDKVDAIRLSCLQFLIVGILSFLGMLIFETPDWSVLPQCTVPLLYTGVLSSGVAFTLQIVAQKGANPTVVSLLMSLESVFAVLAGLVFGDTMTGKEWLGCALILGGVIFAQLPALDKKKDLV